MSENNIPRGLVPVLQLPFDTQQGIDTKSFDRLVDDTEAQGATGVFFPGIASEFYTLDDAERSSMTRRLLARLSGSSMKSIVSITDQSTVTVIRRAREAIDQGADVINVMTPRFWSLPASEVEGYVRDVLEGIPAPVMLQYASDVSAVSIGPDRIREWATEHTNLRAVKVEVDRPAPYISDLVNGQPSLDALVGRSGLHLIEALELGATGVQPVTGFIEVYAAIWSAWCAGDHDGARRLYERLIPYVIIWESEPGLMITVAKRIAARRGLIATDVCRAPRRALDPSAEAMIDRFFVEFSDILTRGDAR